MGLSKSERKDIIAHLKERGWSLEGGTVRSPGKSLWLRDSHFNDRTLEDFVEFFSLRAEQIQKSKIGDWERSSRESLDVSRAAQDLLNRHKTHRAIKRMLGLHKSLPKFPWIAMAVTAVLLNIPFGHFKEPNAWISPFDMLTVIMLFVFQIVVFFLLRYLIREKYLWFGLILLPGIWFSATAFYHSLPSVHAGRILRVAGLETFPGSAKDIRVYSRSEGFGCAVSYLRFTAGSEEIQQRIRDSIKRSTSHTEIFTDQDGWVPLPNTVPLCRGKQIRNPDSYFTPAIRVPMWYFPEVSSFGLRQEIAPYGHWVIDFTTNTVFIHLCDM